MFYSENNPVDTDSSLYKIYQYLTEHRGAQVLPDEIMPVHHAIYYTFINVKNLRDGTDWPPLTLKELEQIINEEFPDWQENWRELEDEEYKLLGVSVPIRKNRARTSKGTNRTSK